jgi:hypothetical protein
VELALGGDLRGTVNGAGDGLTLSRPDGSAALSYTGLVAYDATGRTLPAALELRAEGGRQDLLIQVHAAGARGPITIDPFVQQAELMASGGVTGDGFGYSVAISGNTLVVGAPGVPVGGHAGQGAAYVFTASGSGWANMTQTAELTASDGVAGDWFGYSVAISGNTVVVGAPDAMVGTNSDQGAAYVFTEPLSGRANMTETAKLTVSTGAAGDGFGSSVSISGNTVVVGAPNATVNTHEKQGAAYVFTEPLSGWANMTTQTAKLTTSSGGKEDHFGSSVSISGTMVVVGSPCTTIGSRSNQGAAYVFTESGSTWTTMSKGTELTNPSGAAGDWFGYSVAISGKTVVVGAPNAPADAHGDPGPGAAYVYTESGSNWAQGPELTASGGAAGDAFGCSVSINESGNTVVVGAPSAPVDANGESGPGAAYVFAESGSTWSQAADLTASDGAVGDGFGCTVSISGNTVLAGSPQATVDGNSSQGAAYEFTASGPKWVSMTQTAELTASDDAADEFGWSLAISGNTLVVGAPEALVDAGGDTGPGMAYVFTASGSGWTNMAQTAELTASDGVAGDDFGYSVAISGNTVVVGAPDAPVDASGDAGPGAAYVFTEPASGWASMTETAELTASVGAAGDGFGAAVAISGNTVVVGAPNATTDANGNPGPGAAYVFTEPASGWTNMNETGEFTASDDAPGAAFGAAVAISGNTAVVGAPNAAFGNDDGEGAAYVFAQPVSGWANTTQTAKLTASDGASGDGLGNSVAISGNTVVAGSPGATTDAEGNPGPGAAYVFLEPGSAWANMTTQTAKLTASNGVAGDGFGSSVAISGNTVVAEGGVAVYVFGPAAVTWCGGGSVAKWSNAANWGGVAAAGSDSLCFGGTAALSNANDLAAGTQFDGMTFSAGAGAFVLSGNAVNLAGDIANNSASTQTIDLPLVLTGGSCALNAAAGNLTVARPISESGGSFGVTVNGPDTVTLAAADSYTGGTTVGNGLLAAENSTAIPSGSLLSIGPDGSVVLGTPGASEPLAAAQSPGAGPLQAAVGQTGAESASLVASSASVTPAGAGTSSPAASDAVLAAAAVPVAPTAAVAPAAVDSLLATQPVPESRAVGAAVVGRESLRERSVVLPPSRSSYSGVAVDHTGGQAAGDAMPRVAALRTAASGQASNKVLLRFAEARAGNAAAPAGNQHPATAFFGLDLPTLDLLAAAATQRQ